MWVITGLYTPRQSLGQRFVRKMWFLGDFSVRHGQACKAASSGFTVKLECTGHSSVLKGVSKKKRTQRTVKLHLPTKKLCCSLSLSQGQHCRLKKWIGEIRTWLVLQQILDEYFPLIHLIPVPPSCLSQYPRRAKGLPTKIIRQNSVLMVLRSQS